MRFHDHTVQAQKHTTIYTAWIDATFQALHRRKGKEVGKTRYRRGFKGLSKQTTDQTSSTFTGFDRNVACETVCHNDICDVSGDVATLNKTDKLKVGLFRLGCDQFIGFVQFRTALVLFGPHIQQANAGTRQVHAVTGIRCAHQCVTHQIISICTNICANVQHDVKSLRVKRWPKHGNRRTINSWQLAQAYHRYSHQCTSVTAAYSNTRITRAHSFYSGPHGCFLAVTNNLARLVFHRNNFSRITNSDTAVKLLTSQNKSLKRGSRPV